jgi:hypothetical protein
LKSRFLEGLTRPELKSVMAASTQRHYPAKSVIKPRRSCRVFLAQERLRPIFLPSQKMDKRFCFFGSRPERYSEVTHSWRNHRIIC